MSRKKFEYGWELIYDQSNNPNPNFVDEINKLGLEGWEILWREEAHGDYDEQNKLYSWFHVFMKRELE